MNLFPLPQTGARRGAGGYTGPGRTWVDGVSTPFSFYGNIQPASPEEVEALLTGRENKGMIKIYTTDSLVITVEDKDVRGDLITWDGKVWEVMKDAGYKTGLIPHRKYFATYYGEAS